VINPFGDETKSQWANQPTKQVTEGKIVASLSTLIQFFIWNTRLECVNSKQQTLHTMEAEGATLVQFHFFLTSAQYGGECSSSRSGRFNPAKTTPVPNE
jgi:hypothetical protein